MNGVELQDREFFGAIREGREPNASVAQVLPCSPTRLRTAARCKLGDDAHLARGWGATAL